MSSVVSSVRWVRLVARLAALAAALCIGADDADVRLADGLSFAAAGSGAIIEFVSVAEAEPTMTRHAPAAAPAGPQTYPGGSLDGLFKSGGWLGGFAAGFLGSGLLGFLFDRGIFAGLGGVASYLGLFVQLALLAMLGRLIWTRWRTGDAHAISAMSARQLADPYLRSRRDLHAGLGTSASSEQAVDAETQRPEAATRRTASKVTDPGGK